MCCPENSTIETWAPARAAAVLDVRYRYHRRHLRGSDIERPIDTVTVARYAALMREGRWIHNWSKPGVIVCSCHDGQLIGGRHRLSAVVEAGVDVELVTAHMPPVEYVRQQILCAMTCGVDLGPGDSSYA